MISIEDLAALKTACLSCTNCELAATRTQVVFSRGNPHNRVIVVGEAPGAEEDKSGRPFTGASGQLLDKMFLSVGLSPNFDLYITNTVRCRPPGNRVPSEQETESCRFWLEDEITLIDPKFIVAVGATSLKWFTKKPIKITQERGKWFNWQHPSGVLYKVIPIFHPSFLLRQGANWGDPDSVYNKTFNDLKAIAKALKEGEFENA